MLNFPCQTHITTPSSLADLHRSPLGLEERNKFIKVQQQVRRYYPEQSICSALLNKVQDRHWRQELHGDICLRPDPAQYSELENWNESQNYRLELDEIEKKKKELLDDEKALGCYR